MKDYGISVQPGSRNMAAKNSTDFHLNMKEPAIERC